MPEMPAKRYLEKELSKRTTGRPPLGARAGTSHDAVWRVLTIYQELPALAWIVIPSEICDLNSTYGVGVPSRS